MAILYKHGEIGQIERLCYKVAYCEDGKVLKNTGQGWKVYGKLKPGIVPREAFEKAQTAYAEKLRTMPLFAEWRKKFHSEFNMSQRYLALEAIKMLGNDLDGLWSELNDMAGISIDVESLRELLEAYQLAQSESKDHKQAQLETVA